MYILHQNMREIFYRCFMKNKILLSMFCMVISSMSSAFSMASEDEDRTMTFKVRYFNNALSTKEDFDNVSFSLVCTDGERKQELGHFIFNACTQTPVHIISLPSLSLLSCGEAARYEGGSTSVTPNQIFTDSTDGKSVSCSLSLDYNKNWEILLFPTKGSELSRQYNDDGISLWMSYAKKHGYKGGVCSFDPRQVGSLSFLKVNVYVNESADVGTVTWADHSVQIGGF